MMSRRILPVVMAVLTTGCVAQVITGGTTVMSGDDAMRGDLLITSGSATLEEGSPIEGSVILIGGSLDVVGEIGGDVLLVAGSVQLEEGAVVRGNIRAAARGKLQSESAKVQGKVRTDLDPVGVLGGYLLRQYVAICGLPTVLLGAILYLLFTRKQPCKADETILR